MRDHHDRLALLGHRAAQERQYLGGGVGVQVAGWLVGEDQRGPGEERPRAGGALLLTSRELARAVRQTVGDAELTDQIIEPPSIDLRVGELALEA